MKLLLVFTVLVIANLVRASEEESSTHGPFERVKRNSCNQNCNSYGCSCSTNGREPLCKVVNVHNKWVVDAANCVSYCVRQSSENSGGYCKQDTCYCNKRETLKPSKSLCEWVKVNGKMVIDAGNCVSHCVHMSPENSGGYCKQDSCFCEKREILKPSKALCEWVKVNGQMVIDAANCVSHCVHLSPENSGGYCKQESCFCQKREILKPSKALCEWVKVNGQMVVDAANCVSHCVHLSAENSGGYCKQDSCFCQKREILKPSKALCEWVKVNGKMVIDAANCVSHCVHQSSDNSGGYCKQETCYCEKREMKKPLCAAIYMNNKWVTDPSMCAAHCKQMSHENSGGYCQQNNCFCQKAVKKPLCQVINVHNKWVTDASGCGNHCMQVYKGMKNYGYCQGNTCYCK